MTVDTRITDALTEARIDFAAASYDPDKSFRDNGIDSLDIMNLYLVIEEKYGCKFSDDEVDSIRTPAGISALLDRKIAA